MKYFKYFACGPNVVSNLEFKVRFEDDDCNTPNFQEYLDEIGYDYCVENWESYGNISEYEEVHDIEWEADFYWSELTEEEFNECSLDEYYL